MMKLIKKHSSDKIIKKQAKDGISWITEVQLVRYFLL